MGWTVPGHPADLLSIVALESQRAKAVIVGEDLGTVEEEVRAELTAKKILSYCLLWFESRPPARFPEGALAAVTTHDLPTIAGLWSGKDLDAQARIGLSPNAAGTAQIKSRIGRLARATARTPIADVIVRVHEGLGRLAFPHRDRDAGRRDGRRRAAEHAGDDRRVAELAARAAAADRVAGRLEARQAHRAGAEPKACGPHGDTTTLRTRRGGGGMGCQRHEDGRAPAMRPAWRVR